MTRKQQIISQTRKQQIISQAEKKIQDAKNFKIEHLLLDVDGKQQGVTCLIWENTAENPDHPQGFISIEYLHFIGIV